jgi:hypothetical protein
MNDDKVYELLEFLRRPPVEAAVPDEHLTFRRSDELSRNPSSMTEGERDHVGRCTRCSGVLVAFERERAERAEAKRLRWTRIRTIALRVAGVVLLPFVSLLIAGLSTASAVSDQTWWRDAQARFLEWDVGLVGVMAVLSPVLRLFGDAGLMGRVRLSLPLSVLGFILVSAGIWSYAGEQQRQISRDLNASFSGHRWIAYDPPGYDPYTGRMPSEEEMEEDLRRLHEVGGFDGVITFAAHGTLAEIPRLAKKVGFEAVIMGISIDRANPVKPQEQMEKAIAARDHVDGYCLGHNPPMTLDFKVLAGWMDELRKATKKPVTTTAPLISYVGDRGKELRDIGDWAFPDCVGFWHLGATPKEVVEQTQQMVRQVAELSGNKPVLMKMISFPSAGETDLSEKAQEEFFKTICRDLYLPIGVNVSFYSGYDLPWMDHNKHPEWSKPQQHVGLFTADRKPKRAVEIVRRGFPVQNRK